MSSPSTIDSLQQLVPVGGWRITSHARIPPLQRQNTSWLNRLTLTVVERIGRLDASNLWLLLMRNIRLMVGFLAFAHRLMPFGELPRRDTEIVILRVAWNCRSRYEWGQHVDIGLRAGLKPDDIIRITVGSDASGWSHRQATLLKAADEFHVDRMISESTWSSLAEFLDHRLLIELLMLLGFYEGLAGVLNSVGLPLDTVLEQHLTKSRFPN